MLESLCQGPKAALLVSLMKPDLCRKVSSSKMCESTKIKIPTRLYRVHSAEEAVGDGKVVVTREAVGQCCLVGRVLARILFGWQNVSPPVAPVLSSSFLAAPQHRRLASPSMQFSQR